MDQKFRIWILSLNINFYNYIFLYALMRKVKSLKLFISRSYTYFEVTRNQVGDVLRFVWPFQKT